MLSIGGLVFRCQIAVLGMLDQVGEKQRTWTTRTQSMPTVAWQIPNSCFGWTGLNVLLKTTKS